MQAADSRLRRSKASLTTLMLTTERTGCQSDFDWLNGSCNFTNPGQKDCVTTLSGFRQQPTDFVSGRVTSRFMGNDFVILRHLRKYAAPIRGNSAQILQVTSTSLQLNWFGLLFTAPAHTHTHNIYLHTRVCVRVCIHTYTYTARNTSTGRTEQSLK